MSKYAEEPLSFDGLKTVPIVERGGKVRVEHFAQPYQKGDGVARLLDSMPKLLAADAFRGVVDALQITRPAWISFLDRPPRIARRFARRARSREWNVRAEQRIDLCWISHRF